MKRPRLERVADAFFWGMSLIIETHDFPRKMNSPDYAARSRSCSANFQRTNNLDHKLSGSRCPVYVEDITVGVRIKKEPPVEATAHCT